MCEIPGSNPSTGSCMFITKTTVIYSLVHGQHTFITVPQPSSLPWDGKVSTSFLAKLYQMTMVHADKKQPMG